MGPIEDAALYQQAKAFAENVSKGDVKVKHGDTTQKQTDTHF